MYIYIYFEKQYVYIYIYIYTHIVSRNSHKLPFCLKIFLFSLTVTVWRKPRYRIMSKLYHFAPPLTKKINESPSKELCCVWLKSDYIFCIRFLNHCVWNNGQPWPTSPIITRFVSNPSSPNWAPKQFPFAARLCAQNHMQCEQRQSDELCCRLCHVTDF